MFDLAYIRKFGRNRRGSIAIIFALMFTAVIGFVGLSVDVGSWVKKRSDLVAAADLGSVAGTKALVDAILRGDDGNAEAIARAAALKYAEENGGAAAVANINVSTSQPYGVTVKLNEPGKQYFSKAVGQDAPDIGVVSQTVAEREGNACVVALDPDGAPGIEFNLSGEVVAHNCSIWSNSETSTSMDGQGSGRVSSDHNCAGGTADMTSNIDISPTPESNCIPVLDPFRDWTPPSNGKGKCDEKNLKINTKGETRLNPGLYCGGIRINGSAEVVFEEGDYVIDGGEFATLGGAKIWGRKVSFLLTGGATLKLSGTSELDLSAPTSGPMDGMIFAAGRDEPSGTSNIGGNNLFRLEGSMYLPTHALEYKGGPDGGYPTDYTNAVAATLKFSGSTRVEFRRNTGGGADHSAPAFSKLYLTK